MHRSAISVIEFGQMLHACRPPDGWGNSIAVAHSGGADSTCLLFLLHRWLSQQHTLEGSPRLVSLSVDHSLQPGSAAVASQCRQFCEDLGISSQILHIPWSHPPFPPRPGSNGPIETIARQARYRLLFKAMRDNQAAVIAMGHHADDQVETLIMRLARTRSTSSLTGMRCCRRWGMGSSPNSLDWAGSSGMHHWIVRPLLNVPKDRILATCNLHRLRYVDDPTNFQPLLTPRNFVRHCLSGQPIPNGIADPLKAALYDVDKVHRAISELNAMSTLNAEVSETTPLSARLHAVASHISHLQECMEQEATRYLEEHRKPSPPSTLLLLHPSDGCMPAEDVQRAVILRILRYISPKPWGAPGSEAMRRSISLRLISSQLWNSTPEPKRTFCAGSEVVWRPVFLKANGSMRLFDERHNPRERVGWLASRQPPIKRTGAVSPCVRDISDLLSQDTESELLWDNRYVLTVRPRLLPTEIRDSCSSGGSVMVVPHGRWLLPKVLWLPAKQEAVVLGGVGLRVGEGSDRFSRYAWINLQWTRSLEAI